MDISELICIILVVVVIYFVVTTLMHMHEGHRHRWHSDRIVRAWQIAVDTKPLDAAVERPADFESIGQPDWQAGQGEKQLSQAYDDHETLLHAGMPGVI